MNVELDQEPQIDSHRRGAIRTGCPDASVPGYGTENGISAGAPPGSGFAPVDFMERGSRHVSKPAKPRILPPLDWCLASTRRGKRSRLSRLPTLGHSMHS